MADLVSLPLNLPSEPADQRAVAERKWNERTVKLVERMIEAG